MTAIPPALRGERALVLLLCALWTVLAVPAITATQAWFAGVAILLVLMLDVLLVQQTGGLPYAHAGGLDERMRAARDTAYRYAFRLLGIAMLVFIIAGILGSFAFDAGHQLVLGIGTPRLVALLELLVMLPTAVIAWTSAPADADAAIHARPLGRLALAAAVAVLATAAFVAAANVLPARLVTSREVPDTFYLDRATCGHFSAARQTALGFGPASTLRAEVCWNGRFAFVFGDPALDGPPGAIDFQLPTTGQVIHNPMPSLPHLTNCAVDPAAADVASVSQKCSENVDADGTMHYQVSSDVHVFGLPWPVRHSEMNLVVTRDGRVLRFP